MNIKVFAFAILTMFSTMSHAVVVNFSGNINSSNPGPFSGGDFFSGSFTLDESISPTGVNNRFSDAVNNFILEVNGNTFTGEGGDVIQRDLTGEDYLSITVDDTSTTGQVDELSFTGGSFEFFGLNLFSDPTILANNLTIADFSQIRYIFRFGTFSSNAASGNYLDITSFDFGSLNNEPSVVPVPAAAWLFGSALLGFIGFGRRKKLL